MATSSGAVAYLDSSALVKLVALDPETGALRRELGSWPRRASSLLAAVELMRTARRLGPQATAIAPHVLTGLQLLSIDPIVPAAIRVRGPVLRSLDAIHLATAASLGPQLGLLITYDQRMLNEAQTLGLPYAVPS